MDDSPSHDDQRSPGAGPEDIARAVVILKTGGVVAFPTETVYGLGADALNPAALARVFALKGRPATNPLIVHVSGEIMARQVVSAWPDEAARLARAFWPGPLTLVLLKSPRVPNAVTAGGPTVAVRCPDHHVTLALLEALGGPLVGPSANPSGRVSPTTAAHVRDGFGDSVFVLEGGPCRAGIESTVVSLAGDQPRILRPGMISAAQIAAVLGRPVDSAPAGVVAAEEPAPSPGMQKVHYAPSTPAVVFDPGDLAAVLRLHARAVVLSHSGLRVPPPHATVLMPSDAGEYAARLYAALREADAMKPTLIAVELPPSGDPVWYAIADRLRRAARPFRGT